MIAGMHELRIGEQEQGQRLDRYLRRLLATVPLGAIFRHLRNGAIKVDGRKAKPELRLVAGMVLQLRLRAGDLETGPSAPLRPAADRDRQARGGCRGPEPRIVHRDADVLIVDKPAGLAVQPGSGQGDRHLVAWLLRIAGGTRTRTFTPAPAHRIDRGTSGLCAIGLSPAGLRGLTAAFRDGTATKVYFAVVHGVPSPASGTIEAPLRAVASPRKDGPKVEVHPRGKPARTDYQLVGSSGDRALLRLHLHTGRMHQIRAHLRQLGHPIVGDRRYGSTVRSGEGMLLHAAELRLPHPTSGEPLVAVAALPATFAGLPPVR